MRKKHQRSYVSGDCSPAKGFASHLLFPKT